MNSTRMTMPPPKAPCKDCEDRHRNCHGECEKYKVFKFDRIITKQKIRKAYMVQSMIEEYECRKADKYTKRINRK